MIVVVGETASGKSALALRLAQRFNGEIIAADSWTVRREVNIGTAKPTAEERVLVPHHLLDIVDPCAPFTAAVFKRLAEAAVDNIEQRGKLPIMVGGTGLYIDSLLFDYGFLEQGPPKQRQYFNSLTLKELITLAKDQNLSLEGIDMRNKRRVIRVLETGGQQPKKGQMRPNTLILGCQVPRDELKDRIIERIETMVSQGLEQEVKLLAEQYGWECEALKGIGYQEWRDYFDGKQDLVNTKQRIVSHTLGLAKRQRTWFKRNKSIQWVNSEEVATNVVKKFLSNNQL